MLVAQFDDTGACTWAAQFGDNGDSTARGVAVIESGDVFVAGHFSGQITFMDDTLTGPDVFVAKLPALGIGNPDAVNRK